MDFGTQIDENETSRDTETNQQVIIQEDLLDNYKAINAALAEACGLALKQPITGRQYVLTTDASFRASGYAHDGRR